MRLDVIALRNFYHRPLGGLTADLGARSINAMWPSLRDLHVAGFGYAVPYLERLTAVPQSRAALMPAAQGAVHWPSAATNAAALVEETRWPVADGAYDRIILAHAVEVADDLHGLLRETWRVLAPGGRVIVLVPKRRGSWSGLERTPFGQGRPFSPSQLSQILSDHLLPPVRWTTTMFLPPFERFGFISLHSLGDRIFVSAMRRFGGLLLLEAEKQVYGGLKAPAANARHAAVRYGARIQDR